MRIKSLVIIIAVAIAVPAISLAALTAAQIQEIINMLTSFGVNSTLINSVQTALTGPATGTASWCHTFNSNLGWAQSGTFEIGYLHTALDKQGIIYAPDIGNTYNIGTSQGVIAFQRKFSISLTGYAGPLTRTKLNSLYGCNVATINITSPNGGETWTKDYFNNITWESSNILEGHLVKITLFNDTGYSYDIVSNVLANTKLYRWTVLNTVPNGSHYKIKISDASDNTISDESNNYFTITNSNSSSFTCGNTLIDTRDNKSYPTAKIGGQCWMAKNFDYDNSCTQKTWINSTDVGWCGYYTGISSSSGDGLLYQWSVAHSANFCPSGWHLPTDAEWHALELVYWNGVTYTAPSSTIFGCGTYRGEILHEATFACSPAGTKLREVAGAHWYNSTPTAPGGIAIGGDNSSGFSAIGAGYKSGLDGTYGKRGEIGTYWSSTEYSARYPTITAWTREFDIYNPTSVTRSDFAEYHAYSVRCIQDTAQ